MGALEINVLGPNLDIFGQISRCQARRSVPSMVIIVYITMFFSSLNSVNLFRSMDSECSVPPGVGRQGGRRTTATTMVIGALTKHCD